MRKFLNNLERHFSGDGKLKKFYAIYEMVDHFLYTGNEVTDRGPHVRDGVDLKRAMVVVVIALLPALFFGIFNVGYQQDAARSITANFIVGLRYVIPIIIVSYAVGGFWEVLFAIVRKHEVNEGFLVTGLLIPMIVPPTIPLWMVAVATSFGVVIGKEIFGGTGFNIFNPALVARAFLFFAYPAAISGDKVWAVDGISKATPLAVAAATAGPVDTVANSGIPFMDFFFQLTNLVKHISAAFPDTVRQLTAAGYTWSDLFLGFIPGSIGETSTLAILVGALVLLVTKIANWRIMASGLLGMIFMSVILNIASFGSTNPMLTVTPMYHFVMGGYAFGLVFMATDPVSSAQTNRGRWFYGLLIGILVVLIRSVNPAFPEGMMLVILLGNAFAPLIDYGVLQRHIKRRQKRYVQ